MDTSTSYNFEREGKTSWKLNSFMHEELHKVSMAFEEQEYNRNMRQNHKYKPIIKSKPST